MNNLMKRLISLPAFDYAITLLIIVNSILIGVELDYEHALVRFLQDIILFVFTLEIAARWIGKSSAKEYLQSGWNWFDIFLVAIAYVPESLIDNNELLLAFRILRVFRVVRLLKAFPELQVIAKVLLRSILSLIYVCALVLLAVYLYSVMGVILFRGKSEVITGVGAIKDPFASVPEAMFSMFRVLTGEDWTDLRYDLLNNESIVYDGMVTFFFLSFFILSAFLLINIVVGAVVNNYDQVMAEDKGKDENEIAIIVSKLDSMQTKLESLLEKRGAK